MPPFTCVSDSRLHSTDLTAVTMCSTRGAVGERKMKLDFTRKLNEYFKNSKFLYLFFHSANMKPSSALCAGRPTETEALLVPEDTPRFIAVTVFTFYGA